MVSLGDIVVNVFFFFSLKFLFEKGNFQRWVLSLFYFEPQKPLAQHSPN